MLRINMVARTIFTGNHGRGKLGHYKAGTSLRSSFLWAPRCSDMVQKSYAYPINIVTQFSILMVVLLALVCGTLLPATASAHGAREVHQGAWSIVPGPPTWLANDDLHGIATIASNDVWVVGDAYGTQVLGPARVLTAHWNGNHWSVVNAPDVGVNTNQLLGVAAVSSTDVWAVGTYYTDQRQSNGKTLIEHWNGMHWAVVASPNAGSIFNTLSAVTAVSANDVWAVGSAIGNSTQTLIEHWDGTRWSVVKSPNPGKFSNGLGAITAVSANDIWAVGGYANSNINDMTLTEHWNGSTWSVVPSPNVGRYSNDLYSVSAASASDVWAVGYDFASPAATLIEHWNGSKWSVVANPNPGNSDNSLHGVAVVSANDVWAVGSEDNSNANAATLIEHWNGSSWSVVASPNVPVQSIGDGLLAVAKVSANDVWAIGFYLTPGLFFQPLIEHYS